jgi:hypothetical protein
MLMGVNEALRPNGSRHRNATDELEASTYGCRTQEELLPAMTLIDAGESVNCGCTFQWI